MTFGIMNSLIRFLREMKLYWRLKDKLSRKNISEPVKKTEDVVIILILRIKTKNSFSFKELSNAMNVLKLIGKLKEYSFIMIKKMTDI